VSNPSEQQVGVGALPLIVKVAKVVGMLEVLAAFYACGKANDHTVLPNTPFPVIG
jgi:hypothetical protein